MSGTNREAIERLIAEDLFEQLRFRFHEASDMHEAVANCEPLRALIADQDRLRKALADLMAGVERDDNPSDEGHRSHSTEMDAARSALESPPAVDAVGLSSAHDTDRPRAPEVLSALDVAAPGLRETGEP